MKGLILMKRLTAVFSAAILMMLLTVFSASAYDYSVLEAEFDIPDEFSAVYGEDMPETEVFRFIAADNSVELSCYHMENTDEVSFAAADMAYAVDYFLDNLSAIDGYDYSFDSMRTYQAHGMSDGIMFEGEIEKSGENIPVYVYAFSTTGNLYAFEFKVYNPSGIEFINDIVNSIYITDYETDIGDEDFDDSDSFFELFALIGFSAFSIISAVIKSRKKNSAKENRAKNTFAKVQNMSEKLNPEKININKFELNGKNINVFNERFTVGKADDNFARNELERERKEREKMFSKGE